MNDKIWQRIGDYCSGLLDKSEERELRAWMDEAEENKQLFMEGVKMVREYQMVACSGRDVSDSLKRVREKIKVRRNIHPLQGDKVRAHRQSDTYA